MFTQVTRDERTTTVERSQTDSVCNICIVANRVFGYLMKDQKTKFYHLYVLHIKYNKNKSACE